MKSAADLRVPALRRFAFAISLLNLLGHTWFGFEQPWAAPFVGLFAAYVAELALEWVGARAHGRRPRFLGGGFTGLVTFLLSAHITGLAVAMLLYAGDRLWPIAFAAMVAIGSKHVLRVPVAGGTRHFLNPSNFGITVTLLALPSVGAVQPYMFTANLGPVGAWVLPAVLITAGTMLNAKLTKRLPLIGGWLAGFALQAVVRHWTSGHILQASLLPMTGLALELFTLYMVTDPATTPSEPRAQWAFGGAVGLAYGALVALHVVYMPFLALTAVSTVRGLWLASVAMRARARVERPELGAARAG